MSLTSPYSHILTSNIRYRDHYPNNEAKQSLARDIMQKKSRDNARTPVQWTSDKHAGFTSGSTPWMRVNDDYTTVNAAAQIANPEPAPGMLSVHAFWKRALENRKKHADVFVYGDFEMLDMANKKVVAFRRWSEKEEFITVCNFSGEKVIWEGLGDVEVKKWVAGNYDERELEAKKVGKGVAVELRPWEGVLGVVAK
jgi:oligo-1,6-glucosidase